MLENKSGNIAVMSSTAGKAGVPFSGTYTGSKHAIHGYFESLRTEKVMIFTMRIFILIHQPNYHYIFKVFTHWKKDVEHFKDC